MNKITIVDENIVPTLDDNINIKIEKKFDNVKIIKISVLKDTNISLNYQTNDKTKLEIHIHVPKNIKCNLFEYKEKGKYKIAYKYNLEENSHINIIKINDTDKITEYTSFNLNGQNATVDYLFKTISKKEEKYIITVYHNAHNTVSNITNHGVNIKEGKLKFDVSSFVPKGIKKCITSQKNRIINLTNETCEIRPNLFIDEFDVVANHGAHIGKCKDEELFYLQSRGINKKEAEKLLIKGFLKQNLNNKQDIMEKIINKYWS